MPSQLFLTDAHRKVEQGIVELLNAQERFLSRSTASSTRAVGDAIQDSLSDNLGNLLGVSCAEYSSEFARRAMADMAFTDHDGNYYVVDVKTHRTDTKFNMPNLISVRRLAKFYEDDRNYFLVLIVTYTLDGFELVVEQARLSPIESYMWDCLTIGALGWGQVQIANSNYLNIRPRYSRREWMLELCDAVLEFYPREITKISERMQGFERVRAFWLDKKDDNL